MAQDLTIERTTSGGLGCVFVHDGQEYLASIARTPGYTIECCIFKSVDKQLTLENAEPLYRKTDVWVTESELRKCIEEFTESGIKFHSYIDLTNINDSMELESDNTVATLYMGDFAAVLQICGDVRVEYGGNTYRYQSDFPEELLQMFHDGTAYEPGSPVAIDNNNWFEVFIDFKDQEGRWTEADCEVVDAERMTPEQVKQMLVDFINDYKAEHQDN